MTFHVRSSSASRWVAAAALAAPMLAMAQTEPVCDGRLFLSQNSSTSLNSVSTTSNPMTFTAIGGAAGITYNALGYSPTNGQLYAMRTDGNGNFLQRLDQTSGTVTNLGAVASLPASPVYNTGTVGTDGTYYVKPFGNTSVVYAIDTAALTASAIALSQPFTASDMAWVGGVGGSLYSVADNGQLFSINVADGTVTPIGTPDATGGVLGAQFGGTNGLFGSANNGSGFYQIDLGTGQKTLISGSPASGTNDGANCPNAAITFPADLSITKTNGQTTYTPGTNVVYTITVTNQGPFAAMGAKVTDALPSGISTANWSCTASAGGSCTASGTGGIDDTINLPNAGTATYTLTMAVPANFTGNLANTATVAAADGTSASADANAINVNPDPNPANDSATATVTPPVTQPATPVPTLDVWALGLLAGLLGVMGFRRRGAQ
ncbi:DUF11 domain-containing protein [Ottowia sp.]|jgi:uncharacterized repeat protein (TIGR01451 family)|uniref:DUF11 domain-containing protein n=1 Tax=Ottowia sp. TaxID=1898956 RepID=UPI0025D70C7A|nr:DUF11 domain-containing protein [Ottowia sp.]MBK6614062.1 DUF11 domain-containing protein [Ottowia sp.]